ncbi:MAG: helix-turn-helix transcriptional regulator [Neisseria sp.]|nr:helix-turn-helix transcriptional regulator [Neisseria sp.]
MVQLTASFIDKMIGKRIQAKRKELGLSAEQLSELIGLSQQQLSRYERGVNKINVSHLVSLANYLSTPISYFFLDCIDKKESPSLTHLDNYWLDLSDEQKKLFVDFLKSIRQS